MLSFVSPTNIYLFRISFSSSCCLWDELESFACFIFSSFFLTLFDLNFPFLWWHFSHISFLSFSVLPTLSLIDLFGIIESFPDFSSLSSIWSLRVVIFTSFFALFCLLIDVTLFDAHFWSKGLLFSILVDCVLDMMSFCSCSTAGGAGSSLKSKGGDGRRTLSWSWKTSFLSSLTVWSDLICCEFVKTGTL